MHSEMISNLAVYGFVSIHLRCHELTDLQINWRRQVRLTATMTMRLCAHIATTQGGCKLSAK